MPKNAAPSISGTFLQLRQADNTQTGDYNMSRMYALRLVAALALLLPAAATAQVPADLRAAMRARDSAVARADAATWDRLTAAGFSVVQENGALMSKAERLSEMRQQTPSTAETQQRVDIQHHQDVYVRRFLAGSVWVLDIWVKEAAGWRVVAVQVTTAKQ